MIRLGLRLTLSGGREAAARLVVTATAVALGVGMLLAALACLNALNAQNGRATWLDTGERAPAARAAASRRRIRCGGFCTADQFGNQTIDRVDVAATGPDSPVPPGIPHLPGPGQFYASPALSKLLRATPADQLGDRFPGTRRHDRRLRRSPSRMRWSSSSAARAASSRMPMTPRRSPASRPAEQLQRQRAAARHRRDAQARSSPSARRTPLPGSHLHRHRDPARRGAPRAALRRDASGGRDPAAGLRDRRRRGLHGRRRRRGRRLRPVLPAPPGAGDGILHRRAVLPRRPVARAWPTSCSSPSASRPRQRWRPVSRCGGCRSRRSA